jgi:hypothetical protein
VIGRRVWIRPGGRVLAHDPDGWPLPAGHVEALAGVHWLWGRTHVWPCHWTHYTRVCQGLAVWRTAEPPWRNFYCDTHLPHRRPPDEPSPTCRVCSGPMALADYEAHPGCDMSDGVVSNEAFDTALRLLSTALDATEQVPA